MLSQFMRAQLGLGRNTVYVYTEMILGANF